MIKEKNISHMYRRRNFKGQPTLYYHLQQCDVSMAIINDPDDFAAQLQREEETPRAVIIPMMTMTIPGA